MASPSWKPAAGERDALFRTAGERLRWISVALIDGRLGDAHRALEAIRGEALPPAFDLIRKLHAARLEKLRKGAGKGAP